MANDLQNGFPQLNTPFVDDKNLLTVPWYRFLISLWNRTGGGGGVTPGLNSAGFIVPFAGQEETIPEGYLLANGQAVSRTLYPELFLVCGIRFGAGDGLNTFNVPDLRNKFSRGAQDSTQVGVLGGADSVVLSVSQLAAHSHGVDDPGHDHTTTDPGHAHGVTDPGHLHGVTDPGHTHDQRISAAASADGVLGSWGGNAANDTTVGTTVSATTGVTVDSATTGVTVNSAITGLAVQAATTGISTQNEGGGAPVPTLPAFVGLLMLIKT